MPRTWNSVVLGRHLERLAPLLAAAFGALFFVWIAGARVINPTETSWSMNGDWRIHFLGWQFFRHEPWHLPPGRIDRYFVPMGTAVGLTDSIPIAAFLLKPFSRWLPPAFQYLGGWLCLCFALQGAFAVLLMRLWTSSALQQLLGAMCFVLVPTLLMRTLHPALCAHWLLLWALWLYFRADRFGHAAPIQTTALALVAGMVHPYLAVMVLAILTAIAMRLWNVRATAALASLAIAGCATLVGWWLSGLFTVSSTGAIVSEGLRKYSTNLLAPITPTGWSTLLPELPIGAEGQAWEGFHYFGAGLLLLMLVALAARIRRGAQLTSKLWPLGMVAGGLAIYSLSPRVTFGGSVVFEITSAWIEQFAAFRATGRFFWPATYLLLLLALATIVSRMKPRFATALLCIAILVQLLDLREAYASRRGTWRSDAMFFWRPSLGSPVWQRVLPHYSHIVIYPPSYCGVPSGIDVETVSYLAALHGLSVNAGLVARYDESARQAACDRLTETLLAGIVDDASIYLGRPGEIDLLKGLATQPVVCGLIETAAVCATAKSYQAWRDAARLE